MKLEEKDYRQLADTIREYAEPNGTAVFFATIDKGEETLEVEGEIYAENQIVQDSSFSDENERYEQLALVQVRIKSAICMGEDGEVECDLDTNKVISLVEAI